MLFSQSSSTSWPRSMVGPFDFKFFISSHKFRSCLRTTSKKQMAVEIDGFKFESRLWLFLVIAWSYFASLGLSFFICTMWIMSELNEMKCMKSLLKCLAHMVRVHQVWVSFQKCRSGPLSRDLSGPT